MRVDDGTESEDAPVDPSAVSSKSKNGRPGVLSTKSRPGTQTQKKGAPPTHRKRVSVSDLAIPKINPQYMVQPHEFTLEQPIGEGSLGKVQYGHFGAQCS